MRLDRCPDVVPRLRAAEFAHVRTHRVADKSAYDLGRWYALKAAAPDTTCEACGVTFKFVKKSGRSAARFCSNACYRGQEEGKMLLADA